MSAYLTRLATFTEALLLNRSAPQAEEKAAPCGITVTVDFEHLRRLCHDGGVPDVPGYRSLCWKLLLNYLPSNKSRWAQTLESKRRAYRDFVLDLAPSRDGLSHGETIFFHAALPPLPLSRSASLSSFAALAAAASGTETTGPDLKMVATSWQQPALVDPCDDTKLLATIEQDVLRTSSALSFFQSEVPRSTFEVCNLPLPRAMHPQNQETESTSPTEIVRHYEVIQRILFIYAKLNPGIGYIQGMNHLVFPLYYLLAASSGTGICSSAPNSANSDSMSVKSVPIDDFVYAESDTFYLFHEVMTDYRDFFMNSMDTNQNTGIYSALRSLSKRVGQLDHELATELARKGVHPEFYAFRWYTCLCAQDLELPEVLRLWDNLFADRLSARKRARREYLQNSSLLVLAAGVPKSQNCGQNNNSQRRRHPFDRELTNPEDDPTSARPGMFLTDVAAEFVCNLRERLLVDPFDECVELLQHHPWEPLDSIIKGAHRSRALLTSRDGGDLKTAVTRSASTSMMNPLLSAFTLLRRSPSPKPTGLGEQKQVGDDRPGPTLQRESIPFWQRLSS